MPTLSPAERAQLAAQRLLIGLPGPHLDSEARGLLRELRPLGVILFGRQARSAAAARALIGELKAFAAEAWGGTLMATVDHEGGRVQAIGEGTTAWPSARAVGAHGEARARAVGAAMGLEVRAMGFDVNFAPVLDVDTAADSPIIGPRAFGRDPEQVAALGAAMVLGLQESGVAACGKHFPGHGDAMVDSHLALPHLALSRARLEAVEWPPFAAAIGAGVSSLMSAHVRVEGLDPEHPATLSAKALGEPLRQALGFRGVVVADDVQMRALSEGYALGAIAARGCQAGVDVFLVGHDPAAAIALHRALVQQLEAAANSARPEAAAARARAWSRRWCRPLVPAAEARQVLAAPAHRALAAAVAGT